LCLAVALEGLTYLLDLCVSSMHRGHANLFCIVPILSDFSEEMSTIKDVKRQSIEVVNLVLNSHLS